MGSVLMWSCRKATIIYLLRWIRAVTQRRRTTSTIGSVYVASRFVLSVAWQAETGLSPAVGDRGGLRTTHCARAYPPSPLLPAAPPNCPSICPRRYPAQLTEKRDVYRQALLWIGDTRAFAALAGAPGAARVPLLTWTETGHVSWAPIRDTIARCSDEHRTLQAGVDAVGEGSGAGARAITHDDVLAAPPPRPLLELECLPTSFTDFHAGLIARRDFFSTSIDDTTQVAQCLVCGYVYGR